MVRVGSRALLLLGLLAPLGAAAQVPGLCPGSSADFDSDGFSDAVECSRLVLRSGLVLGDSGGAALSYCGATAGTPRSLCLDPATRDLFLIDQTSQAPLPREAFEVFARLGITVHDLLRTVADTSRVVSDQSTQNAVQVSTNPDASGDKTVLGRANWGTPNNLDGVTVYPNRVANFVNGLCPASVTCKTSTSATRQTPPEITAILARWVSNHEAGHTLALTRVPNDRYLGYHEPPGSLTIMEQTSKVVSKRGSVTFFIADAFSSVSAADAKIAGKQ